MDQHPFLQSADLSFYECNLSEPSEELLEFQVALWLDPETSEFLAIQFKGQTIQDAKDYFQHRNIKGGTTLLARSKETNQKVGLFGFSSLDHKNKTAEFGLLIHSSFWGKRYATQIHLSYFTYFFEELKLHRIEMNTDVKNTKMRNFCVRIGMTCESIKKDVFYDPSIGYISDASYVLLEDDWKASKSILSEMIAGKSLSSSVVSIKDNIKVIYQANDHSLTVDEFLDLAVLAWNVPSFEHKRKAFTDAIPKTFNFTARLHGSNQLIGTLRILSDGIFSTIPEMQVHPNFRHLGVGRTLLELAKTKFPSFFFGAQPGVEEFYLKCGFTHGLQSFVYKK